MQTNAIKKLRLLDVDDLIIIALLCEDVSQAKISKFFNVRPSSIAQRKKKYLELWPDCIYKNKKHFLISKKYINEFTKLKNGAIILLDKQPNFKFSSLLNLPYAQIQKPIVTKFKA